MLNRFALVIHWLSLLIAVGFAVAIGFGAVATGNYIAVSPKGRALLEEARSNGDVTDAYPQLSTPDWVYRWNCGRDSRLEELWGD